MGPTLDEKGILVDCPGCGKRNRLAFRTLGKETRCGHCKAALEVPGQTLHVATDQQFESLVTESRLPVLIDFWAEWCGPCKMLAPELEKVAARAQGQVLVAKVNTEWLQPTAAKFNITSIPTLALMREGLEVERLMGARPASDILGFLERLLR